MNGKAPDDSEILDMLNASERRKHTLHELAARVTAHYGAVTEISKDLFQIQEEAREIDYHAFWDLLDDNGKLCITGFSAALSAGPSADPVATLEATAAQIRYSQTFNHGAPIGIPPAVPLPTVQRFAPYMRDDRMRAVLERLFAESAKLHSIPAGESPALECQIVIRNGPTMVGSLSMTPEGLLRFLAAATNGQGVAMLESFFDIADLVSVIVQRTAPAAPQPESRIFQG